MVPKEIKRGRASLIYFTEHGMMGYRAGYANSDRTLLVRTAWHKTLAQANMVLNKVLITSKDILNK